MSTEAASLEQKPVPVEAPLAMKELAALLVKHYGLREGMFDLMVEFQLGTGAVGPDKEHALPGLMIGIAKIGLVPSTKSGPTTVNASEVNAPPKARRKG
jgi:hypothetical protein